MSTGPRSGTLTLIDTHVALWLYAGLTDRLPQSARGAIAGERQPRVSPMSVLELTYMHEIGRARDPVPTMLAALRQSIGLEVADVSLAKLMETAVGLSWTRDPFDRMIVAAARVAKAPLVTADPTLMPPIVCTWNITVPALTEESVAATVALSVRLTDCSEYVLVLS